MTRQAIIFDFDGLILDTESPQAEVWHDLFTSAGAEFDLKVYNSIIGGFNSDVYRPEVEFANLVNDGRTPADVLTEVEIAQNALIMAKPLNPGVVDVLDEAKRRGIVVAVGSSSPAFWVHGHLSRLGLLDRFETVVTYDDVSEPKPSPEIFELVLNRLGVKAEDAIVLEDSANGVLAAHRADIRVVAVPNTVTQVMDFSLASEVLDSLCELDLEKYF
jgi:HAD superfamily hydrolase (TIGR01509 family)